MDRGYEFLLNKYKTKQPGEEWKPETEHKYIKDYRYKQRLFILDKIINERMTKSRGTFQLPKTQKDRARHLIQNLDFYLGRTTETQYIVMIIIYVKLEANTTARVVHYYHILEEYEIPLTTFIKFLINLNKYHAEG